jgi:hypothetical protein
VDTRLHRSDSPARRTDTALNASPPRGHRRFSNLYSHVIPGVHERAAVAFDELLAPTGPEESPTDVYDESAPVAAALAVNLAADQDHLKRKRRSALVAQGIERRFPKPCAKVRILPGAPPAGTPVDSIYAGQRLFRAYEGHPAWSWPFPARCIYFSEL